MPKKSGLTNRSVVNHQNGKGDKTRVTNVQAYRDNFDEINWGPKPTIVFRPGHHVVPIVYKRLSERSLEELRDEYEFRHGL